MSDIFGAASAQLKSELQRGAEVTPPNANDLESAARQMRQERDAARLRQTAIETQGSNPDTAARAQRLGKDMGLPPAVVERNLPEVERQAELSRLDGLSHDDYLANYLADPDNYRVARDDVNMLEEMSKAARQVGNVARAVPGGAVGGAGSAISGLGSGYDALTRNYVGRPIDAALGALGLGSLQDYNAPLPWWAVPTEILRRGGGAIKEIGRAIDPPRDEQNIATDIAGGVGQLGMQIATVILTGGQAAIPMLLAQGADQQAERLERQGKYGTPEGDAAIVAGAAVTALTEKYGLDFIMRKLPQAARDGIMRRLQDVAVSAGAEAVQEVVEGILQNVVEYAYYNPDAEILQDFSREAIAAGGAAAVVRSVLLAASGGRASAQRRQDGQRAEQDSEALKRVNELAEQSKLRERNPDKFREFVRGLVEPDRAVEIDAETAVELFQSEPDLTQFMTRDEAERVGREVSLAREVGSDVRMPLTTFIGAFVGHPQFDTLAENVRLSDNAPTAREASMSPEDLERQVGLLRDEVGTVARQQEATREIYDDIFAQLKAAAYDDLTATKYAAIYTARLRTRGERLGQDPLALHREKMLEIQRQFSGPRLRLARLGTPAEPEYASKVMPSGLKRTLEDARKGVKLKQRSMSRFLVSIGGLRDDGGELMAIMGTYRAMPGLVNNKPRRATPDGRGWTGGLALDMAHEAAIEEGYMSADSTLNEFLDVLSDDVNKRTQNFGITEDFEGQERQAAVDDLVNELDALGLTIRDSDAAIAQALGIDPEMSSATLEDLEAMDRMRFRGAEPAPLGPAEDPEARTLEQAEWKVKPPKKLYRGIVEGHQESGDVGLGTFHLGRGLYSSPSKSFAKMYATNGKVQEVPAESGWPRNPLVLRGAGGAGNLLLDFVFKNTDYKNAREFGAAYPDPADFVKSLGYDGVIAGDEVVRYPERAGERINYQRREAGPRGSIQFMPDGRTIIKLTEKADLSTFLHEMSHDWLEEMKADASLPDAPAQIVEDWNRIAAYLGIDPGVDVIPTEAHETFARTGEAYFMEGKAPSLELAPAFERFKAWMVRIYRTIVGLGVPINDEIRGVFDRMLAADDEIEAAKNQFQFNGLFALAKDAGMTEDEFRRYQDLSAKARLEAEQKVLAMLQAEERQAQREEYRDARETITADVEAEVKGRPVYQTIAMLARGEMPDGTTLDTPMKLDRALVRASYGTGIGKRLPRGVMADNGVPPDLVAPMFGFTSGDEMIKAMEAAPPLQQEIRRIVQERLKAQFPNPVDDGRAAEAAIEALHNDAQMQVLEAEFKALQRLGAGNLVDAAVRRSGGQGQQAGQAMGPEARAEAALGAQRRAAEGKASRERVKVTVDSLRADRKAIERAADAVIGESAVNDLMNTQKWRRAERASANAVIDAVAGQDWPAAAWHQRQRIINAHMVRRSMEARKDIEKAIGRFDKYLSKKPGPIDPDYLEKVRTILSAYQFGPHLSDRRRHLEELRAILDWQKKLAEDEQARLDIPPVITAANEKTHYRDMTVGEFMALRDTVENIATVGRTKNRLLREQAKRDLNKTAELVAETILNNVKTVSRRSRDAIEKRTGYSAGRLKDEIFASHRKMESLLREFDGFKKLGPVWQALFKPLQDAQNTETRMSIEAADAIKKLFESYPADARKTWRTKVTYYPEVRQSLSKATVMSIALNWGNEGNREAIRKGYKWSDDEVRAVLNQTLTESDWQFVQGVWDYIDSFWPKLSALEKRVKGIEPVKVEASPVRTPFGEFRGGYYPLKYDSELSERAFSFQVDKMAQNLMAGQVAKASTRTGAALERVGSGGIPVRLELDVMFEHVAEVIHDLSHREAILDVMRLLEHPEVRGAVLETKGPEFHGVMKNWVRDIAAGDPPALTWFDKVVQHLRSGMSIAAMGWKLTTALVQVTGFVQSAVMLPKGALLKSVAGFYGNPLAMSRKADFVFKRSVEMRTRSKSLDRDIRDTLRKLGPEGKVDALKRSFFYMTGLMDMGVALPTWLAAYETGMDQFQGDEAKAIDYADQVVRTTQSSGLQKDLASIQRGGPLMKMFTAFYSYFSATYNLMVEQHRGMKRVRDMPKFVANMALLTFVPAVLSELLLGRGPDEDEDESWWFWSGKTTLKYLLGAFVGVRDFGNAVLGSGAGYAGSPVGSAIESMVKLTKQIQQGEVDRGLARAAFDTAGPVLHLPSRQAWITAEGIYLWSEGHEITPFEMFVTRDPKKFR